MSEAKFTTLYLWIGATIGMGLLVMGYFILGLTGQEWEFLTTAKGFVWQFNRDGLKLALLMVLMAALVANFAYTIMRRPTILRITQAGIHDARLTKGPIPWHQIKSIAYVQKGWQVVAVLTLSSQNLYAEALGYGNMPLYAFNRWCAKLLKGDEYTVGLGGLTIPQNDCIHAIEAHYNKDYTL